jgi:hypothetical protein
MNIKERNALIIQRRVSGEPYRAIADSLGMLLCNVRVVCMRAMWKGQVTAEQIRYSKEMAKRHLVSDEVYNARWLERLAAKSVRMPNGCIEMPDVFHNADGYSHLSHRSLGNFAHRIVTILKKGPIPADKMACHDCGNHGCVNEDHLYIGTMKQNARDTVNHGRHLEANKTACIHGHPFDEENTWICKKGKRHCKTCARLAGRRQWADPEVRARRLARQRVARAARRAEAQA